MPSLISHLYDMFVMQADLIFTVLSLFLLIDCAKHAVAVDIIQQIISCQSQFWTGHV